MTKKNNHSDSQISIQDVEQQTNILNTDHTHNFTIYSTSVKGQSLNNVLKNFQFEQKFFENLQVNILNTNFQSMKVKLSYGYFRLICHIIFTKFPENILSSQKILGMGVFGKVYELNLDQQNYVIKSISNSKAGAQKGVPQQIYREYFLCKMAQSLGAGPQMAKIFGYDIIVSQNLVFFSMQKVLPSNQHDISFIQNSLRLNLQNLHKFGMIHGDIKPQNIGYSQKQNKHIFIDYGLSKLIKQKQNEKTFISFMGTLHYCNQDMKKCYILQSKSYVNLYQNDKYALETTITELKKTHITIILNKNISHIEKYEKFYFGSLKIVHDDFLKLLATVINLKYQIYTQNSSMLIKLLQKCYDLPFTCYQLLDNQDLSQTLRTKEVMQFKDWCRQKRSDIFQEEKRSGQGISTVDSFIYELINKNNSQHILYTSIPIHKIIQMQKANFIKLMQNPQWLIKIFIFFNPFNETQNYKETNWNKKTKSIKFRKQIINKIIQIYKQQQQQQQKQQQQNFITFKTLYVLKLFHNKLKPFNNHKILLSLRLLFIATMTKFQQNIICQIEQQILQLIQNQDQLMLRLTYFFLFWKIQKFNFDFTFPHLDQKIKTALQQKHQNDKSTKIQQLLKYIYHKNYSNVKLNDQQSIIKIQQIQSLIILLQNQYQNHNQQEHIETLQCNKNLYTFTINPQFHNGYFLLQQQFGIKENLYTLFSLKPNQPSQHQNIQKPMTNQGQIIAIYNDVFLSYQQQITKNNATIPFQNSSHIINYLLSNQGLPILFKLLASQKIFKKSILIIKILQAFQKQYMNQTLHDEKKIFQGLSLITKILTFKQANMISKTNQTSLTISQIQQINNTTKLFIQQIQNSFKNSRNQHLFNCKYNSILIKLYDNYAQKYGATQNFIKFLHPQKYETLSYIKVLFPTFESFYNTILNNNINNRSIQMIENCYETWCDHLIKNNFLYIFKQYPNLLDFHISTKVKKRQFNHSFNIIKKTIETFSKQSINTNNMLIWSYKQFFNKATIPIQWFIQKFHELNNTTILHVDYYIICFRIFTIIKQHIEKRQRIKCFQKILTKINSTAFLNKYILLISILMEMVQIKLYKTQRQMLKLHKKLLQLNLSFYGMMYQYFYQPHLKIAEKIKHKQVSNALISKYLFLGNDQILQRNQINHQMFHAKARRSL